MCRFPLPWLYLGCIMLWAGCGDPGGGPANQNANQVLGICGNGVIEGAEACDDGAANSDLAVDGCRTNCVAARCGDGVQDTGEACDDGAANSATTPNACRPTCEPPRCGDGVVDPGHDESCDCGDDPDDWPAACSGPNGDGPEATCSTLCRPPACGDGIVQGVEACDDGTANADDLPDACREDCQLPRCGDEVVDVAHGEGCDWGAFNSDAPDAQCRTDCQPRRCGDGIIDHAYVEACDDGAANSDAPNAQCRSTCTVLRCGDGIVDDQYGETCDGTNLGGETCQTLGYAFGSLVCGPGCQRDESACDNCGNGWCDPGEDVTTCPAECGALSITAGNSHTCARRQDGSAWCWGSNTFGSLGDGQYTDRLRPVQVLGPGGTGFLDQVTSLTAGASSTCGVRDRTTAWCWGYNDHGELGSGNTNENNYPVQVLGPGGVGTLTEVASLSAGREIVCASLSTGTAFCWGSNTLGQLGDGTTTGRTSPAQVVGEGGLGFLTGVVQVQASSCPVWNCAPTHACALLEEGTVWCWGKNSLGQLGDGTTTFRETPVTVLNANGVGALTDVIEVSTGEVHTCAIRSDGTVWCWGSGDQLGAGTHLDSALPVQVLGPGGVGQLSSARQVTAGGDLTCARLQDGTLWCWGGWVGDGTMITRLTPTQVLGPGGSGLLTDVVDASAGLHHACAVLADGTVWCWGQNSSGELGDDTTESRLVPTATFGWP
jgi:alpha-tubulin suppressor-like RCC1 family protein